MAMYLPCSDTVLPYRVSPFGYLRVYGYLLLTAAFRSLSRPSSAPDAKAFPLRSYQLDLSRTTSSAVLYWIMNYAGFTEDVNFFGSLFLPYQNGFRHSIICSTTLLLIALCCLLHHTSFYIVQFSRCQLPAIQARSKCSTIPVEHFDPVSWWR